MKFDVIIGNPPYQAPGIKNGNSLWQKFIVTAFNYVNKKGIVALIVPSGWLSPTNDIRKGRKRILTDIMKDCYINILCCDNKTKFKKYFPKMGIDFTYFIATNNHKPDDTIIITENGKFNVNLNKFIFLPIKVNDMTLSIFEKVFSTKGVKSIPFIWCDNSDRNSYSMNKTDVYSIPTWNVNTKNINLIYYFKPKTKWYKKAKIYIPTMGAEYKFIIDELGLKDIRAGGVREIYSYENINTIKLFFNHPLILFMVNNKRTQYNEPKFINSIPLIDFTKPITNDALYEHFNLTPEEIKYINEI